MSGASPIDAPLVDRQTLGGLMPIDPESTPNASSRGRSEVRCRGSIRMHFASELVLPDIGRPNWATLATGCGNLPAAHLLGEHFGLGTPVVVGIAVVLGLFAAMSSRRLGSKTFPTLHAGLGGAAGGAWTGLEGWLNIDALRIQTIGLVGVIIAGCVFWHFVSWLFVAPDETPEPDPTMSEPDLAELVKLIIDGMSRNPTRWSPTRRSRNSFVS
jgi:hypothetical protein